MAPLALCLVHTAPMLWFVHTAKLFFCIVFCAHGTTVPYCAGTTVLLQISFIKYVHIVWIFQLYHLGYDKSLL